MGRVDRAPEPCRAALLAEVLAGSDEAQLCALIAAAEAELAKRKALARPWVVGRGERVVRDVARSCRVTPAEIMGRGRSDAVCSARRVAMRALHSEGWTKARIARFFDRDPGTVRDALSTVGAA